MYFPRTLAGLHVSQVLILQLVQFWRWIGISSDYLYIRKLTILTLFPDNISNLTTLPAIFHQILLFWITKLTEYKHFFLMRRMFYLYQWKSWAQNSRKYSLVPSKHQNVHETLNEYSKQDHFVDLQISMFLPLTMYRPEKRRHLKHNRK